MRHHTRRKESLGQCLRKARRGQSSRFNKTQPATVAQLAPRYSYKHCPLHGRDVRYEGATDTIFCEDCHAERREYPTYAAVWQQFVNQKTEEGK